MNEPLPIAGAATEELRQQAHGWWTVAAEKARIDLTGFDACASLSQRLAWARSLTLLIAAILSRFSSKLQHSTASQIQECVEYAAAHGMYVPPELICVDEAVSGRKVRRDGLEELGSQPVARGADQLTATRRAGRGPGRPFADVRGCGCARAACAMSVRL